MLLNAKHVAVYNMRSRINVNSLRYDFVRFDNKTPIARCELIAPGKVLLKKSDYKPFYNSTSEEMMMRTVLFYLEKNNVGKEVDVISSRINVSPLQPYPRVNVNMGGIMCLVRENTIGGLVTINDFQRELIPGEMMIFKNNVDVSISSFNVDYMKDPNMEGFIDIIIFKH